MQFPDCNLVVTDQKSERPKISVKQDEAYDTPANVLVSELMILANEAVGKIGMAYRDIAFKQLPITRLLFCHLSMYQ